MRAAHLFVLLTSFSQLLHSAVKLVLCCLPLRLQHAPSVPSWSCPGAVPCCAQFHMPGAAGWHMPQAALLSVGVANGCCWQLAVEYTLRAAASLSA